MKVVLATIDGWDGTTKIGVFSDRDKALSACSGYLWDSEGKMVGEVEFEFEGSISYSIEGSDEIVTLLTIEVDKPLN